MSQNQDLKRQIDQIKTELYLLSLQMYFGGISLGKLQKILKGSANSGCFYKNMRGTVLKDLKLIQHAETLAPGSQRVFNHPLWLILSNPNASLNEIYDYMQLLHPDIERRLFKVDSKTALKTRKKVRSLTTIYRIIMRGDLDALAFSLMLVKEMEHLGRYHPFIEAKWSIHCAITLLHRDKVFSRFADEVYELIAKNFLFRASSIDDHIQKNPLRVFKNHLQPPKPILSLHFRYDFNTGVLWHAQQHQLINKDDESGCRFLVILFLKYDAQIIDKQLKELPIGYSFNKNNYQELPEPLRCAVMNFHADKRAPLTHSYLID